MYEAWNNVHGLHGIASRRHRSDTYAPSHSSHLHHTGSHLPHATSSRRISIPSSATSPYASTPHASNYSYATGPPSTSHLPRHAGSERHTTHRRTSHPYPLLYEPSLPQYDPPSLRKVSFRHAEARTAGLVMSEVLYRSAYGLERMIEHANEIVFNRLGASSITIRITWLGYPGHRLFNDIPLVSRKGEPITRLKLAHAICMNFSRFIDDVQSVQCLDKRYRLGYRGLSLNQLRLLSITESVDGVWDVDVAVAA